MALRTAIYAMSKRCSRQNLYEFIQERIPNNNTKLRVLNVGAGGEIEALLRRVLDETGSSLVTLDIDPDRSLDLLLDICYSDFTEQFDIVIMAEVLEHVQNPFLACEKVYEALVPGGYFLLTVPFIFPIHDRPCDYWRFTCYGLELVVAKAGFTDISINERNGWGESITVLVWRVFNTPGFSRISRYGFSLLAFVLWPVGKTDLTNLAA